MEELIEQKTTPISATQTSMTFELVTVQAKQRMMIDTMAHSADLIRETQDRVDNIDNNTAKRMVIISGLETARKRSVSRQQINNFITDCLELNVGIEDYYYIGNGEPRDIVVTLATNQQRHQMLQNGKKLKNLVNQKGNRFTVRAFKTTRQLQFSKKVQDIQGIVQEREAVDQEEVSTRGKTILIGDHQYSPRVTAPDPTQVLRLPIHKLNMIMAIQMQSGDAITAEGNRFKAYSVCTGDYEMLQDAYMQVRLNHAEARHIVAAWNIPGTKEYESADGCDDDDHGVAREIVQLLKDNAITHRGIFVVRNCKKKLNAERIPMYIQAVKSVIKKHPENKIAKKTQMVRDEEER